MEESIATFREEASSFPEEVAASSFPEEAASSSFRVVVEEEAVPYQEVEPFPVEDGSDSKEGSTWCGTVKVSGRTAAIHFLIQSSPGLKSFVTSLDLRHPTGKLALLIL